MRTSIISRAFAGTCLAAFALATGCGTPKQLTQEQPLAAPPAGKALVNIHRPSNAAGNVTYPIFHGSGKMLCELPRRGWFQYVCDPGEQVFIAWGEHVTVVKGDLAPDKVYDIMADFRLGWVRNDFALVPLAKGDERRSELADFEKRERFTGSMARTDYIVRYESEHQGKIEEIKRDFLHGEKAERVSFIRPDDCR
jgi:hypothetical protein